MRPKVAIREAGPGFGGAVDNATHFWRFAEYPFSAHGWRREDWTKMIGIQKLRRLLMKNEVPVSYSTDTIHHNVLD